MAVIAGQTPSATVIMPGQTINGVENTLEIPIYLFEGMEERLDNQIDNFWDRSDTTYNKALSTLAQLASSTLYILPADLISRPDFSFIEDVEMVEPQTPDLDDNEFDIDTSGKPDFEQIEIVFNDYGPVPTTDADPPSITYPPAPGAVDVDFPESPGDPDEVTIPTSPDLSIPAVPTLESLGLPTAPDIDFSQLQTDASTLYDDRPLMSVSEANGYLSPLELEAYQFNTKALTAATNLTSQWETEIASTKIWSREDEILTVFQSIIDGTRETGLPSYVEDQLYTRGRSRVDEETFGQEQNVLLEWAAKGFTLPQGAINFRLDRIRQDGANRKQDLNRDIIIRQHETKIMEFWKTVENVGQLSAARFSLYFQLMQLGVDSERNMIESLAQAVAQRAALLRIQVDIYQAAIAVFEQRIRVELAEIDEYRALLEGVNIKSQINEQEVRIYESRLRAVQATADVFRTQMEAARIELEVEGLQLQNYQIQVDGYRAAVEAKKAEVDQFRAQIEAEVAKVDVYQAQIQAYAEDVRAYAAKSDALANQDNQKIRLEEAKVNAFDANIRGYQAKIQAEAERVAALSRLVQTQASIYASQVESASQAARINIESQGLQLRKADILTTIGIREAEILNENRRFIKELQVRSLEGIAQVSAQITAGAMAAMDVSLGANLQNSQSNSASATHTHTESI